MNGTRASSRLLTEPASGVLASLRGSAYGREYDSLLRSLRPLLDSLRATLLPLETLNAVPFQLGESVCQHTAK